MTDQKAMFYVAILIMLMMASLPALFPQERAVGMSVFFAFCGGMLFEQGRGIYWQVKKRKK